MKQTNRQNHDRQVQPQKYYYFDNVLKFYDYILVRLVDDFLGI